ncbi:MAG: hypothetical protein Q7U26_06710 [Aquabacterium sp.]|nr:hypothetical protein [Aquabacterium sp.]
MALLALCSALAVATPSRAQDAPTLTARHLALRPALASNPFGRPLVLESSEPAGGLRGDVYARIDQPFNVVAPALLGTANWCDILMLHLNVKQCRAGVSAAGPTLGLVVGSKRDQPLDQDHAIDFVYQRTAARPDYLQLQLHADQGPMGTSRYRIVLEVVALEAGQSFLHLSYAYDYGLAARLAMETYLATFGRSKVGFSVIGQRGDGQPRYVGQLRGVVERNTMRYYLAIESFLGALALPQGERFERRLASWHAGVERYPLQLHEQTFDEYLTLKRRQPLPG